MGKDEQTQNGGTTSTDPNLRAILDAMQKQAERHEKQMLEMRKLMNDESKQRIKEIEILGNRLSELHTGLTSAASHTSLMTEDKTYLSAATAKQLLDARKQAQEMKEMLQPNVPEKEEEELQEDALYRGPQHSANVCKDFIPILNGQDDIGVEGFIRKVRDARSECKEQNILLKLILTQKIVGEAERSIRHVIIDTYDDLYRALREYVSINITSNSARDKLQRTKQGNSESVHSYAKRFRHQLNELIYALQHEIKEPIRRRVATELENDRATKTFLLNLQSDIELRTSSTKPENLQQAQEAAFEAELFLSELERSRGATQRKQWPDSRPNNTVPRRPAIPPTKFEPPRVKSTFPTNPSTRIPQPKCFKCQQVGHLANQCPKRNFIPPGQRTNPPVHHTQVTEDTQEPQEYYYEEAEEPCHEYMPPPEDYYPYRSTSTDGAEDISSTQEQG